MRKSILILIIALTCWSQLVAQQSKTFDSLFIKSGILKKQMMFGIYLPPGYESSDTSYPVLYLLHGGTGNQMDWLKLGSMKTITDKAIADGKSVPMIIVMPDAEMTFYMNNAQGRYQFEDYFFQEFIPYIEKTYRCRKEKKYRSIAGLSMGGYGSLLYSIHHPELFNSCGALSAAVRTDEEINAFSLKDYLQRYRTPMGDLKEGDRRVTEFWNKNSVIDLVKNMPETQKTMVNFYLDVGDDDFLYKGNSTLHILMRDRNIPHEFRMRDGAHTWQYWKSGLPDVLGFITDGIRKTAAGKG
jgi:S-formylglutathione hydrolase FrmB